jgi:hypothetical protein
MQIDSGNAQTKDENVIMAQSDYFRVFKIQENNKLFLMEEFSVNDKILDMIVIPTSSLDCVFVLTKNLHCLLLGFSKDKMKVELISKGMLKDKNTQELEPPYSLFLGCSGKCIIMMVSQNLLKVIPILKNA